VTVTHPQLPDEEWLELVRQALALPEAPPQLVQSALELWRVHGPAPEARAGKAVRRWVAVLGFDSWSAPPLALGLRAVPSQVRHLLFSADERDVDLRIAPEAEGFALRGQHLGPEGQGQVELTWVAGAGGPSAQRAAALNDRGEFRLEGVHEGTYVLTVRIGDDEIVLPPIEVGLPPDVRTL
jgi:hypothetical protein